MVISALKALTWSTVAAAVGSALMLALASSGMPSVARELNRASPTLARPHNGVVLPSAAAAPLPLAIAARQGTAPR